MQSKATNMLQQITQTLGTFECHEHNLDKTHSGESNTARMGRMNVYVTECKDMISIGEKNKPIGECFTVGTKILLEKGLDRI